MREVRIFRFQSPQDIYTFGTLVTDRGFKCRTGELPYLDADGNGVSDSDVSCIDFGVYDVRYTKSPTRKNKNGSAEWSYEILGVKGRKGIRMHPLNFVGAAWLNMAKESDGCIGLGKDVADMAVPVKLRKPGGPKVQKALTSSVDTVAAFVAHMKKEPFRLSIIAAPFTV